jgi:hypothetical protein
METITKNEAKKIVDGYDSSKIFTVTFVKRTTGEVRVMNCRKGVVKHLVGGTLKYNPKEKELVGVFDMQKQAYRSIALENIQQINMDKKEYKVE